MNLTKVTNTNRAAFTGLAATAFRLVLALLFLGMAAAPLVAQDQNAAEEIIRRMDEMRTYGTSQITGSLIITDTLGTRRTDFISWSRGVEDTLLEFTSAQERGQRILRNSQELYLYFPDAEEVIRLQGAALRQSLAGSDISYEDMTGVRDTLRNYHVRLMGTEEIRGRDTWHIEMRARSRNVAYPRQEIWVDQENDVVLRAHYFAVSGRLLKEMEILEVRRFGQYNIPVRMTMRDTLRANSLTESVVSDAQFDVDIPASRFTLEGLTW